MGDNSNKGSSSCERHWRQHSSDCATSAERGSAHTAPAGTCRLWGDEDVGRRERGVLERATAAAPCRGAITHTNQRSKSRNVHVLAATIDLRTRQVQLHELSSCNITGRRESDSDAL